MLRILNFCTASLALLACSIPNHHSAIVVENPASLYAPLAALTSAQRATLDHSIDALPLTRVAELLTGTTGASNDAAATSLRVHYADLAQQYPTVGDLAKAGGIAGAIPTYDVFIASLKLIATPPKSTAFGLVASPIDSGSCNPVHEQYENALGNITRFQIANALTLSAKHDAVGTHIAFAANNSAGIVQLLTETVTQDQIPGADPGQTQTNYHHAVVPNIYGNEQIESWNGDPTLDAQHYLSSCFYWH